MEQRELTAALLYLLQQYKAGRLTSDQHGELKTQLLSGNAAVKSAMAGVSMGSVDLESLLQRLRLGSSPSPALGSPAAELLRAPLAFLMQAFREASLGRRPEDLCEDWGASERLIATLNAMGGWEAVPLLSSLRDDQVTSGRLVRFRGMVQDMFDPEFYVSVYEHVDTSGRRELRSGMFSDILSGEAVNPASHKYGERQLLYCIPVPAENSWVTANPDVPMDATPASPAVKQSTATKRSMGERMDDDVITLASSPQGQQIDADERQKRTKSQSDREAQRAPDPTLVQSSFPVPTNGPVCLAKIYERGADFKLNEIIEVIGVLSITPELVSFDQETDDFLDPSSALPSSLVPRIHAVVSRRAAAATPVPVNLLRECMPVAEVRRQVVELLAGFLRGDLLAAEYLLLNLISKVHSRDAGLAVGKFVLNISGVEPALVPPLVALLKQLIPRCHCFPFTVPNIHSCNMAPRKDHKSNKLISGLLQLTEGTQLIVDETQLSGGNFSEQGQLNLRALRRALSEQRVQYDFAFHHLEFNLNIPVVLLSRSKALLPADCLVPLRPADSAPTAAVPSEGLQDMRLYLQSARNAEFTIDPEVTQAIEEQFVKTRQQKPETGPELLHSWLTLGRLLATSYGETALSTALWRRLQELENERSKRLA